MPGERTPRMDLRGSEEGARIVDAAALRRRYLEESVQTASPAARFLMLLDKLEMDLDQAGHAFDLSDWFSVSSNLVHAQEVLLYLRLTLRQDIWEGAARMASLYDFWRSELVQVNISKDRERLQEVGSMIAEVAAAWREAALHPGSSSAAASAAAGG